MDERWGWTDTSCNSKHCQWSLPFENTTHMSEEAFCRLHFLLSWCMKFILELRFQWITNKRQRTSRDVLEYSAMELTLSVVMSCPFIKILQLDNLKRIPGCQMSLLSTDVWSIFRPLSLFPFFHGGWRRTIKGENCLKSPASCLVVSFPAFLFIVYFGQMTFQLMTLDSNDFLSRFWHKPRLCLLNT